MGLFSDKCEALIDSATGQALTGPALAKARQDSKWPRCGARVSKKARFCSTCGWTAPGGWWKCPGCGKWVGGESHYCWNCNHPLHPEERLDLAGGVWRKDFANFAQRLEIGDVKRLLTDGLQIQEGTAAIVLDAGEEKQVLGPGRHNPDGTLRKINWFGNPPPRSVVLVDNGDVLLPVRIEGLRSSEEIPLELYAELTFHFVPKQAADFLANLMKERRALTLAEIQDALEGEIRYAAANICNTSTAEDLVKDPNRRNQVEDALQRTLKTALERYGLELVRVGAVDFDGDEYDALREKAGETEIKRRRQEWEQRIRELDSTDKMHQFKTSRELEEYVAQLAQEKQVSDAERDHEFNRLQQEHRHLLHDREARFVHGQEELQTRHGVLLAGIQRDYNLETLIKQAEAEDKAKRIEMERGFDEAGKALNLRQRKNQVANEHLRERGRALEGKTALEQMALLDDPEQRKAVMAIAQAEMQKAMTPEQILATLAAQSPAAAQALGQMSAAQKDETRSLLEEYKQLFGQSRERDERMLTRVTEMMAVAAKRADQPAPQQIIK